MNARSALATLLVAAGLTASPAMGGLTARVSVSGVGQQADSFSGFHSVSADGRLVAFDSNASNLVPGDTNGVTDIFIRNRQITDTFRISVDSSGQQANGISSDPSLSADGRFVAFTSAATNLVLDDTNGFLDVFVHDRQTTETTRVSVDSAGAQASGNSLSPAISAEGRYVVFLSDAPDLVASDTNGVADVFVRDRQTGSTTRVSVSSAGQEANAACDFPSISGDGGFVAFTSAASNLVAGDTNAFPDVFVRDAMAGITIRASVHSNGTQGNGASGAFDAELSADGAFVAFSSDATNLVAGDTNNRTDVFVYSLADGTTTLVSRSSSGAPGNSQSVSPSISADGRYVAFESQARNLVGDDTNDETDVFVRDRQSGETTRVCESTSGAQADLESRFPKISYTGRFVTFNSLATTLTPLDTNGLKDIYVRDRWKLNLSSVSPADGSESGGDLVKILGCGFTSAAQTSVLFGGAAATVVEVSLDRIKVRTPPGTGVADVMVSNSVTSATLTGAYTYVDPALAARYGNVNVALGDREDVLFVNGSAGDPVSREVVAALNQTVTIRMELPSSRSQARFALYFWLQAPTSGMVTPHPYGLGSTVFPTPVSGGSPQPFVILNNSGRNALGAPTFPSMPAPTTIAVRSFTQPRTFTMQGFIRDDGAPVPQGYSITNAVILRMQ